MIQGLGLDLGMFALLTLSWLAHSTMYNYVTCTEPKEKTKFGYTLIGFCAFVVVQTLNVLSML